MKQLLKDGKDPNAQDILGKTPLHFAVMSSNISIVNLLLDAGANVILQDKVSFSPLRLAHSKIIMFTPQDQSAELRKLKEDLITIFVILADHLVKRENGKQLLADNSFIMHSTSPEIIQKVKNNLRYKIYKLANCPCIARLVEKVF